MIRAVSFERHDLQRRCPQVRSGHAAHRGRRRPRRGDRLPAEPRPRPHRARRARAARARDRAPGRDPRTAHRRHGAREGGGALLRARGHPPARRRHDPRHRRHRRAHRAPLRHAGDGLLRRAGDGARVLRLLQHARTKSTGSSLALDTRARGARLMDLKDLYRDVILDHNRSPRNFGKLDRPDAHAEGFNPAVRRPAHLYVALDGERIARHRASRARAARSRWPPPRS